MMIHARRGGSKTFLALAMGLAVAAGTSLLRWSAPKPRRVLYLDEEMALVDMQRRVAALKAAMGVEVRNDHFHLLAADHTGIPDLATRAGQRVLDPLLDGVNLLIIDNISTLCWAGSDNNSSSWSCMQEWILQLRKRGLAVLLVHHSGKTGNQRGTSRREDVLDTVLGLRRPEDYLPEQGARFEVHIEKSRAYVWGRRSPVRGKACGNSRRIRARLDGVRHPANAPRSSRHPFPGRRHGPRRRCPSGHREVKRRSVTAESGRGRAAPFRRRGRRERGRGRHPALVPLRRRRVPLSRAA